ncbi:MAG: DotU family type IV/VI secretion system protein [Deltaproteobacteria bacterium]|jgi:type VI protein secretion system component VasF|nr:DotU family type IV/VI secretion system protein [Deltaproteobacteria bacterium]
MRFAERFFRICHQGLLESTATEGAVDWDETRRRFDSLFSREERLALPPGYTEEDRNAALTPIYLWLDERILNSNHPEAEDWTTRSFQLRYLYTNQGGELFFESLHDLLERRARSLATPILGATIDSLWVNPGSGPDPLEGILDCYALALALGYAGRYYAGDPELLALRDLAMEQLSTWGQTETLRRVAATKVSWLTRLGRVWQSASWVVLHVALPLAVLLIIWLRRSYIINSLPF